MRVWKRPAFRPTKLEGLADIREKEKAQNSSDYEASEIRAPGPGVLLGGTASSALLHLGFFCK